MGISESEAGEERYSKWALRADDSSDRVEFVSIVWRLHLTRTRSATAGEGARGGGM
jgi:hypothetical protein